MKKIIITITEKESGNSVEVTNEGFGILEVIGLLEMFKYKKAESYFVITENKPVTICSPCIYYDGCFNNNKDNERCVMFKEEATE